MQVLLDFVKWAFVERLRGLVVTLVFLSAVVVVPFFLDRIVAFAIAAAIALWLYKQAEKMFK